MGRQFGGTVGVVRARDLTEEGEAEEPPRQRHAVSEAEEQVIPGGQEVHDQHDRGRAMNT